MTSQVKRGPVLVGIDGSPNARAALDVAVELAMSFDVELTVVHALGLLTEIDGQRVPLAGHESEVAELLESNWCAHLRDMSGLQWHMQLEFGPPSDVMLRVAASMVPSFIVVGSRGLEDRPERLLGSTSHRVVHHANCPIVVVPPTDQS